MKKTYSLFILMTLSLFVYLFSNISNIYASSYGSCDLKIKVSKVHEPVSYHKEYKVYQIKTDYEILTVDNIKGHSGGQFYCQHFKKGQKATNTLYAKSWDFAVKVKASAEVLVKYEHVTGFNNHEHVSSSSFYVK